MSSTTTTNIVDPKTKCEVTIDTDLLDAAISKKNPPDFVGSIDQGTSSTRFLILDGNTADIVCMAQMEFTQIFPSGEDKVGWHEHDPFEIWQSIQTCIDTVSNTLHSHHINLSSSLRSIGITNQRETTIAWNAKTGIPYHNAIVWDDTRTSSVAHHLAEVEWDDSRSKGLDRLRERTGLPLASYFAGTKVRWLIDNVLELQLDLNDKEMIPFVRFGTIDTWIVYQLTGSPPPTQPPQQKQKKGGNVGGLFITDVTNASRWLFLDLKSIEWDQSIIDFVCSPHHVPHETALPKINPSSHVHGKCSSDCGIKSVANVPIGAILGDQQAALFGQCGFGSGEVSKCTFGTGSFLLVPTGSDMVNSHHGLLTTIAYQISEEGEVVYALEGSISHSGSTLQWLRDKIQILSKASESESMSKHIQPGNDSMYLVPAFSGLFAPYWDSSARACFVGMTASHTKNHMIRAALEAGGYMVREVMDAIRLDMDGISNTKMKTMKVDGGGSANAVMMQFVADMVGVEVVRPKVMETTARGAGFAAGLAVGVWKDLDEIRALWVVDRKFQPMMGEDERDRCWKGWKKAVDRSLGWVGQDDDDKGDDKDDDKDDGDDVSDDHDTSSMLGSVLEYVAFGAVVALAAYYRIDRKGFK